MLLNFLQKSDKNIETVLFRHLHMPGIRNEHIHIV